jgi:hypothetical protein
MKLRATLEESRILGEGQFAFRNVGSRSVLNFDTNISFSCEKREGKKIFRNIYNQKSEEFKMSTTLPTLLKISTFPTI